MRPPGRYDRFRLLHETSLTWVGPAGRNVGGAFFRSHAARARSDDRACARRDACVRQAARRTRLARCRRAFRSRRRWSIVIEDEAGPASRLRRRFRRARRASPRMPAIKSAEIPRAPIAAASPRPEKNDKCPTTQSRTPSRRAARQGPRCGAAQTRCERSRAAHGRAWPRGASVTAAPRALRRVMRICGAFCRRFETVVRSTCIDVSYLRKRLSQFVGCTGFFLATM